MGRSEMSCQRYKCILLSMFSLLIALFAVSPLINRHYIMNPLSIVSCGFGISFSISLFLSGSLFHISLLAAVCFIVQQNWRVSRFIVQALSNLLKKRSDYITIHRSSSASCHLIVLSYVEAIFDVIPHPSRFRYLLLSDALHSHT